MISDEARKTIDGLSWEELVNEINRANRSRFQGDSYAYLKTRLYVLERTSHQGERKLVQGAPQRVELGFEDLLHPVVRKNAYQLYRDGHLREAVLNSMVAVFDLVRARTGLTEDGDRLIGQ